MFNFDNQVSIMNIKSCPNIPYTLWRNWKTVCRSRILIRKQSLIIDYHISELPIFQISWFFVQHSSDKLISDVDLKLLSFKNWFSVNIESHFWDFVTYNFCKPHIMKSKSIGIFVNWSSKKYTFCIIPNDFNFSMIFQWLIRETFQFGNFFNLKTILIKAKHWCLRNPSVYFH